MEPSYEKLTRELDEYKRLYRDAMEREDLSRRQMGRMNLMLVFLALSSVALIEVKDCISERKQDEACRSDDSR